MKKFCFVFLFAFSVHASSETRGSSSISYYYDCVVNTLDRSSQSLANNFADFSENCLLFPKSVTDSIRSHPYVFAGVTGLSFSWFAGNFIHQLFAPTAATVMGNPASSTATILAASSLSTNAASSTAMVLAASSLATSTLQVILDKAVTNPVQMTLLTAAGVVSGFFPGFLFSTYKVFLNGNSIGTPVKPFFLLLKNLDHPNIDTSISLNFIVRAVNSGELTHENILDYITNLLARKTNEEILALVSE